MESILGQYFICMGVFLGQITTKNLSLRSWEITKKSFRGKLLKIFHFFTLWIWLFGIFDKRPQGCYEVKYSMGLLQGPRLMARTTKSPIQRNHWVPLGCRGHLGSVKSLYFFMFHAKTLAFHISYTRHHNPLLIINHSWILTIHMPLK